MRNEKNILDSCFLLLISLGIFFIVFSVSTSKAYSTSITATVRISVCGNQVVEYGEDCDNSDLGGKTCEKLGYDKGNLTCRTDCSFDKSDCKKEENKDENNNNSNGSSTNDTSQSNASNQGVEQQPSSVVSRIEKDNETRTLEIEDNSMDNTKNFPASEDDSVKIIITDSQGNNIELNIVASDNKFVINQDEVSATSQFSVIVDKDSGKVFILGPEGKTELKVSPKEIIGKIRNSSNKHQQIEDIKIDPDNGRLVYIVSMEKEEKFLGLFRVNIPLRLKYSIRNGDLIKTEQSLLWKLVDLFSF